MVTAAEDIYLLNELDMELPHPVLEAIIPDGVIRPARDSAHHALNQRFLSGSNVSFQHTFAENLITGARDCAMAIAVI